MHSAVIRPGITVPSRQVVTCQMSYAISHKISVTMRTVQPFSAIWRQHATGIKEGVFEIFILFEKLGDSL